MKRMLVAMWIFLAGCTEYEFQTFQSDTVESEHSDIFFCDSHGDDRRIMLGLNPPFPYSAVGYLNNGCSATLIDEDHILTAAHCVADTTGTGRWLEPTDFGQPSTTPLRFYLNFHPDRVQVPGDPPPFHPLPYANIERAVAGTRAEDMRDGLDWAIAKIGPWRNLDESVSIDPAPIDDPAMLGIYLYMGSFSYYFRNNLHSAGYPRDDLGAGPPDYLVPLGAAPSDGASGGAVRWNEGRIDPGPGAYLSSIHGFERFSLRHSCASGEGDSGGPIFGPPGFGIIGVNHGASLPSPPSCENSGTNQAVTSGGFAEVPRFASNIAVTRVPNHPDRTMVVAIDTDRYSVVYRYRASASRTGLFSSWSNLGTPGGALS